MRRSILTAFVIAIALAIGFNTAATAAVDGNAQATAKKKAGKKKSCKPKKGKKKAGKSLADSAAKKKASGCKPKKKAKAKAKAKPKGPAGATLADGTYEDAAKGVVVTVTGNGTQANISGASSKCSGGIGIQVKGPIAPQGSTVKGTGSVTIFGGAGTVKWTLIVTPSNLTYQFNTVWTVQFPEQDPCQDAKSLTGTLEKQ